MARFPHVKSLGVAERWLGEVLCPIMSHSAHSRGGEVFARVTLGEALPERLDVMTREIMEHVLPALRMQDGFAGAVVLADRSSGKVQAVTLWQSEQAMNATEEAAYWLRVFSAEAAGGMVSGVERYEVVLSDVERVQPSGEPPTTEPSGT